MMLGTSPAHEALIHRPVSSSRGVPSGAKHGSVSPPSAHMDVRSASPVTHTRSSQHGFSVLSSSPSETGNGASMVTPPSSFGGRSTHRRRSGEGVALTPSLSPTVTGFTVPPSSNEGGSVGTKMMTRMTPLGARSPVDFPEETVVGFDIGVQHVESKSPPMSPGGLSRSMSALKSELVSVQTPSLSPEKPPLHSKAAGQSGLLSGRLEALTADEESTLEQAQHRHQAFSSPAVVSAFRVAAAAHRGQLRNSGDTVLSAQVATALIVA